VPLPCATCSHPAITAINQALVAGDPGRSGVAMAIDAVLTEVQRRPGVHHLDRGDRASLHKSYRLLS